MFDNYEDLLSDKDLSVMLGIGMNNAYELIHSGEIEYFKLGRINKVPKQAVIKYIIKM